jgi:TRAP-type mannitol/chloroaromatic compound transport system substrate-binding protein
MNAYDAVKAGTVPMAMGSPNWWIGKNPAWYLLNDQPFGFQTEDSFLMWYYSGDGMKIANEATRPDNIIWRPAFFSGKQTGAFCRKPIRTLAEMKGKKLRIGPGLHMKVLQKHGVQAVTMPGSEIYQALDRGVVDMAEWFTPTGDYAMNFHEAGPNLLVPAWWQPSGVLDFLINIESFNALPEDLQAMLETVLRDFSHYATFKLKSLHIDAMQKFEKAGCKIFRLPDEDMRVLEKDSLEVIEEYADKYAVLRTIWESQKKFRAEYDKYEEHMRLIK